MVADNEFAQPIGWDAEDTQYHRIVDRVMNDGCGEFRRTNPKLAHPVRGLEYQPPFEMRVMNWTERTILGQFIGWEMRVSAAIVALSDFAISVRLVCGASPWACEGTQKPWGAAWCLFLRRLRKAVNLLPIQAFIPTVLGVTAREVLERELPRALQAPLSGLASGRLAMDAAHVAIANATLVFREFVGAALHLGEEMMSMGVTRVSRAVFHGDACNAAIRAGKLHNRADVLLWILLNATGDATFATAVAAPKVVELGVLRADTSFKLLSEHENMTWLGIDSYEDFPCAAAGECMSGNENLLVARKKLKPWLYNYNSSVERVQTASRAKMLIARSGDLVPVWGDARADLVFVDGDHSENGARTDIRAWGPKVRPGGIIAGHDYHRTYPGVVRAVHSYIPPGSTLHLAPDMVFWWRVPDAPSNVSASTTV